MNSEEENLDKLSLAKAEVEKVKRTILREEERIAKGLAEDERFAMQLRAGRPSPILSFKSTSPEHALDLVYLALEELGKPYQVMEDHFGEKQRVEEQLRNQQHVKEQAALAKLEQTRQTQAFQEITAMHPYLRFAPAEYQTRWKLVQEGTEYYVDAVGGMCCDLCGTNYHFPLGKTWEVLKERARFGQGHWFPLGHYCKSKYGDRSKIGGTVGLWIDFVALAFHACNPSMPITYNQVPPGVMANRPDI